MMLGPLFWLAASTTLCSAYESAAGGAGLVKIRQLDIQHAHPVKVHGDPGKTSPIHRTKPSRKPFVTLRNGQLVLDDPKGTPFRFASMNAPELLTGEPFEVEDTMKTVAGFGRAVTRTYTLTINGTGPSANTVAHINCWDEKKGDWEYQEGMFRKVSLRWM